MPERCSPKNVNGKEYRCFFELALLVMGGKWKPVMLYHLARFGEMRFGELRRSLGGISERMLARQLKELEADGLIRRTAVPPARVDYALTEVGRRLVPSLLALRNWGLEYERHLSGGENICGQDYEELAPPRLEGCPELSGDLPAELMPEPAPDEAV